MVKPSASQRLKQSMEERYFGSDEQTVFSHYIDEAMRLSYLEDMPAYAASQYFQQYNDDRRKAANVQKWTHRRINSKELLAVTQLFTPPHLCAYVTENSLGKLLYEAGYLFDRNYFDGAPQNKITLPLTDIRVFDPACGTGNLLFSACGLLLDAYQKAGYTEEDAKRSIGNNLIGFDIDARAAKTAKKFLQLFYGVDAEILCPSFHDETAKFLEENGFISLSKVYRLLPVTGTLSVFDKKEYERLLLLSPASPFESELNHFTNILRLFSETYHTVLINPPYLASSDYGDGLKQFIFTHYHENRADLFSVFTARCLSFLKPNGYIGVVCPYNWMFIKQFEPLRLKITSNYDILNVAMLPQSEYRGAVVYLSAFTLRQGLTGETGTYIRLTRADGEDALKNACKEGARGRYRINQSVFSETPYRALIFWTSKRFFENYRGARLSSVFEIRQGMATGDNKRFLKKIREVNPSQIDFSAASLEEFINNGKQYALYSKGGQYRKWFGNIDYVIRFDKEARDILAKQGNNMPSRQYYFKTGITWTLVSSKGHFGARICRNSVFDVGGSCGFPKKPDDLYIILAYLCSSVATYYLNAQNPTLNCQVGDIKNLPYIEPKGEDRDLIDRLSHENVRMAEEDWHNKLSPHKARENALMMLENEVRLNAVFARIYGLEGETEESVPMRLITLTQKGGL